MARVKVEAAIISKRRGGIKGATQELKTKLASGNYSCIIRSDAKGYYAHIQHHKLIGPLKDYEFSRDVCRCGDRSFLPPFWRGSNNKIK